ncbi:MAG: hypothetical protein A2Z17_00555 [Gammaproteobacteria bacterium RBG_16_66_13]|nr:MAG: hypothetical protein A2Z17_00555 [Gammaproteobacteria bacterium RBG_16_66_13]
MARLVIDIRRHRAQLAEEESAALAKEVAELILAFFHSSTADDRTQEGSNLRARWATGRIV